MNGAGNDFIVIDNRFFHFSPAELSDLAARFCPRRVGVGADGLLAFAPADEPEHDFRMHYYNADGSRGTMCGNGARCLARYARTAGLASQPLVFETDAGVFEADVSDDPEGPVRLRVQPPRQWATDRALKDVEGDVPHVVDTIWTGTEHAVCLVGNVERTPVASWGPAIRHDAALSPIGANVNFVEVVDEGAGGRAVLRVRTFEKGVEDETLACGTGAMAAAVATRLRDRIRATNVEVRMPGGTLLVGFDLEGEEVRNLFLEGPAVTVFRGTVEV